MTPYKTLLFLLLVLILPFSGCRRAEKLKNYHDGDSFSGRVIGIIDGDTFDMLIGSKSLRIRLYGIDAPERDMPFYEKSKQELASLIAHKQVRVIKRDQEPQGRTIGDVYLDDGRWVNYELVKAGMAWHFKRYSSDKRLNDAEREARNEKQGLWADPRPLPPWKVRNDRRNARRN